MLTRVAVFEGALEPGSEETFFADVTARLEPIWRSFPHVQAVRVLRTTEADPGAIPVVMVLEMDFTNLADMPSRTTSSACAARSSSSTRAPSSSIPSACATSRPGT